MSLFSSSFVKSLAAIAACMVCFVIIVALFFRVIDAALEIDDLKQGAEFRYQEAQAMMAIANAALGPCSLKVDEFERVVKDSGLPLISTWDREEVLVGSFTVTKNGDCIEKISALK